MITFIDLHEVSLRKPFVNLPYTIPLTYTLYSNNIRSQGIEAHFGVTFCFYSKSDKNQSRKINWNNLEIHTRMNECTPEHMLEYERTNMYVCHCVLHYIFDVQVECICLEYTLCKFQAWQICIKGNNGEHCYLLKSNLRKLYFNRLVSISH